MDFGNLKGLSNHAMVGATMGWVDPDQVRPILAGIPEVSGFMGKLDAAHNGLIACQVSKGESEAEVRFKALSAQAESLDRQHDNYVRGIYMVLEGAALLAEDKDVAAGFADIQQVLFPEGLSAVSRTYLEESGNVALVKGRLDERLRSLLRSIPTEDGNLEEKVDRWFDLGDQLGNVEREKAQVSNDAGDDSVTRSDVVKMRSQWIRVVRAILAGLELADSIDDATATRILQPLKSAVDKVQRRAADKSEAQAV